MFCEFYSQAVLKNSAVDTTERGSRKYVRCCVGFADTLTYSQTTHYAVLSSGLDEVILAHKTLTVNQKVKGFLTFVDI